MLELIEKCDLLVFLRIFLFGDGGDCGEMVVAVMGIGMMVGGAMILRMIGMLAAVISAMAIVMVIVAATIKGMMMMAAMAMIILEAEKMEMMINNLIVKIGEFER